MTLPGWLQNRWVAAGGACLLGAAGGYGAGRLYGPTREEWRSVVSIQEKLVEVEKEVVRVVQGPVRVVTKTVERLVPSECPGQPPVILTDTEVIEDRGPVVTDAARDERRELEELGVTATEHVVERDAPRLTLLFTFGTSVTSPAPVYGGAVTYRVLGPLTLGAGFDSSLRATVAAGLQF